VNSKKQATLNKLDGLIALMSKLDDRLGYRIKTDFADHELKHVHMKLIDLQKNIESLLSYT